MYHQEEESKGLTKKILVLTFSLQCLYFLQVIYQSLHDIISCAPPPFSRQIVFFARSEFSELVLVLRQLWVSHDNCCVANGADNDAADIVATYAAVYAATYAEYDD